MNSHPLPTKTGLALKTLAASLLLIGGLTGCSSSSDDKPTTAPGTQTTAVSGTAAKGILRGALVEAFRFTTDTNPITTAKTREDGSYTLNIPANQAGTLIIRVRHQTGAKMICDVPNGCGGTSFRQPVDMEEGLALRSVATVEPSATTVTAHITPITELVTAAAIQSRGGQGTLNADALTKGNAAVRHLLGLGEGNELTQIQPVDITNEAAAFANDEALQLSLLAAAFAQTDPGQTIADKVGTLTNAIQTGSIEVSQLTELTTAATAALEKAAESNTSLSDKKQEITKAINDAKETATTGCGDTTCSVNIDVAEPTDEESKELSRNVAAVKSLVADVRTLGWEIYPQLDAALTPGQTGYDNNNLIAQIEDAGQMFDEDFKQTMRGISAVATLLSLAIEQHNQLSDMKISDSLKLRDIAKVDYIRGNSWRVRQPDYNWCDNPGHQYSDCLTEQQLEDLATADAEQFNDISLVRTGNTWTVTKAEYTPKNNSAYTTSVTASVTFPDLKTNASIQDAKIIITAEATSKSGNTKLVINEGLLSFELSNQLPLELEKGEYADYFFIPDDANPGYINAFQLKASAELTHKEGTATRTFSGSFDLQAGTSAKQKAANPENILAVFPQQVALAGSFTAPDGKSLEANLTVTLDNFEDYTYLAAGTASDVPVTLTLKDENTLEVKLGDGNNALSFELLHGTGEVEWVSPSTTGSYIEVSNCSENLKNKGWFSYLCGDNENKHWISSWDYNTGIESYPIFNNLLEANQDRNAYPRFEYLIEDNDLQLDTSKGRVQVPSSLSLPSKEEFELNNGIYTTQAIYVDGYFTDTQDNHLLATIAAEVKGKLSANLPEMDVKLQLKRTAFRAGEAELTLGWTETNQSRKFLQLTASAAGANSTALEESLKLHIRDAAGTTLQLLLDDETAPNKQLGRIVKDGTTYATVTRENGLYLVTYHFDDEGKKQENSEEFETLY